MLQLVHSLVTLPTDLRYLVTCYRFALRVLLRETSFTLGVHGSQLLRPLTVDVNLVFVMFVSFLFGFNQSDHFALSRRIYGLCSLTKRVLLSYLQGFEHFLMSGGDIIISGESNVVVAWRLLLDHLVLTASLVIELSQLRFVAQHPFVEVLRFLTASSPSEGLSVFRI